MKKNYILAIDQGTTGSTALIIDLKGNIKSKANTRFKQIFPKVGWVEHNPADILKSVQTSIIQALKESKIKAEELLTIGITNQRETVVFWDRKTGKPLGNAIVWQCRRTSKRTAEIKKSGDEKWIKDKTGLNIDPYFSSTKIEWFLKNNKKNNDLIAGNIDAFLLYNLSGGESFCTEPSNASRTQLYNIKSGKWDEDLLKYFGVNQAILPEVLPSNSNFGKVKNFKPLLNGTPITGILGDQQSALFGQGALKEGDLKCTFGTGSFIFLNTGKKIVKSKSGLLSTIAWKLKDEKTTYALEGGAFNCGSCISWFRDELGVISTSAEIDKKSKEVKSSDGVLFAPSFSGLGAPYWTSEATGGFTGITRGTKGAHLAKAVLEGLSFQNKIIFDAMEKDYKKEITQVFVDGGASASDEFMKIQSKLSNKKITRPKNIETTAMGAALMAGVGAGVIHPSKKVINKVDKSFKAKPNAEEQDMILSYEKYFKSLTGL